MTYPKIIDNDPRREVLDFEDGSARASLKED